MPDIRIRIRQYTFTFPAAYEEGQKLTAAEAKALDALRAENIRNNMTKIVDRELAVIPEGQMLSKEVVEGLQERIADYADKYRFPYRFEGSEVQEPAPNGTLEAEARAIAEQEYDTTSRRLGETPTDQEREAGIKRLMGYESIQAQARKRLATRAAITHKAIGELGL